MSSSHEAHDAGTASAVSESDPGVGDMLKKGYPGSRADRLRRYRRQDLIRIGVFALTTFPPVTAYHLIPSPSAGEAASALLITLGLALAFATGGAIRRWLSGERTTSPKREVIVAFLCALVLQAFMWGFWSALPEGLNEQLQPFDFAIHLLICLLLGAAAMPRKRKRRVPALYH